MSGLEPEAVGCILRRIRIHPKKIEGRCPSKRNFL